MNALMSLDEAEVKAHEQFIRSKLLELYDRYYETAKSNIASDIRKAICRVDELLFSLPRQAIEGE